MSVLETRSTFLGGSALLKLRNEWFDFVLQNGMANYAIYTQIGVLCYMMAGCVKAKFALKIAMFFTCKYFFFVKIIHDYS